MGLVEKIFGTHSERELKKLQKTVDAVMALEDKYTAMSEEELRGQTAVLKARLANGETLDDILPEAFATVREAAWRVLGMKHYRVQVIGGIIVHQGRIAELKTGEGKTLMETLPAYLNALAGEGVHIVTVNEYLARRDSEWMGKIYKYLGLTVGLIVRGEPDKKKNYAADITYGTNNEFGFDYLRDNMVIYKEQMSQRGHAFAIVDEVDSILVDEARTPLIISGTGDKSTDMYVKADAFVKRLRSMTVVEENSKELSDDRDADYIIDEKAKTAQLTARGMKKAEEHFGVENISDGENMELNHHLTQALKANGIMKRDVDYVVKNGEIIIVDEFTGRLMPGRRYSLGLHQAIEAKEKVVVRKESKTLATITFQNYFRLYKKLSGMTGTALTEENEFREIYNLDVVEVPTNKPMVRIDHNDMVYSTVAGKYRAVVQQVIECHKKGQPVLVGTVSIEKSELLSTLLKRTGIPHNVLNAKNHEREAEIVAQAGKKNAVTIATNMAGRGTDIILGGNAEYMAKNEMRKLGYVEELINESTSYSETDDVEILEARAKFAELEKKYLEQIKDEADEVRTAGGLFIIGTERHESRRIDNQLRGRAGRQGDPGESCFYVALEDDLMRLFGGERIQLMMERMAIDENQPIAAGILSGTIESAQRRIEGRNFDSRKRVLQYDDVMNLQREIIYGERKRVLDGEDIREKIMDMVNGFITAKIELATGGHSNPAEWDMEMLGVELGTLFATADDLEVLENTTKDEFTQRMLDKAIAVYGKKEQELGSDMMRELERVCLLKTVDRYWMDHIDSMDELRRSIGLAAYANKDPVQEYKFASYDMFEEMTQAIKDDTVKLIFRTRIQKEDGVKREQVAKPTQAGFEGDQAKAKPTPQKRNGEKVGRNDPCPCGSGLKYKKCCGKE